MFVDMTVMEIETSANDLIDTNEILTVYVPESNENSITELNLNEMNVIAIGKDNLSLLSPFDNILSFDAIVQIN